MGCLDCGNFGKQKSIRQESGRYILNPEMHSKVIPKQDYLYGKPKAFSGSIEIMFSRDIVRNLLSSSQIECRSRRGHDVGNSIDRCNTSSVDPTGDTCRTQT